MNILVVGGTRFFGIPMVEKLIADGHDVTIATRGKSQNSFGESTKQLVMERTNYDSVKEALAGKSYDVIIDKIAYSSNDVVIGSLTASHVENIDVSCGATYGAKLIRDLVLIALEDER